MQRFLARNGSTKTSVFVVWEPILATDWMPPGESTLARIPDKRARQFWDPNHVVAISLNEFAKQKPNQPHPECCVQKGFNWDEVILYAPYSQWSEVPVAAFWNGPIVKAVPSLEKSFLATWGPG